MANARLRWAGILVFLGMLALAGGAAAAAELELQGHRLLVSGALDRSALEAFDQQLRSGQVQTVVFEDAVGGTADVARGLAQAIRSGGLQTEVVGQCRGACAYAFLAGKLRRFGRGLQVNGLLIPAPARPTAAELASRWSSSSEGPRKQAEFHEAAASEAAAAPEQWQPDRGVLFTSSPTLFGRIHNSFYCDGTQGRDFAKCERLPDADPFKLGVVAP